MAGAINDKQSVDESSLSDVAIRVENMHIEPVPSPEPILGVQADENVHQDAEEPEGGHHRQSRDSDDAVVAEFSNNRRPGRRFEAMPAVVVQADAPSRYAGNSRAELSVWYEEAKDFRERRSQLGEYVTWRSLIAPEKLIYIAYYGFPGEEYEVSLLTDAVIQRWIHTELRQEADHFYLIQAAMAKLKMVPTPGVPLNGVEKFMQEFEDIIQRHRL